MEISSSLAHTATARSLCFLKLPLGQPPAVLAAEVPHHHKDWTEISPVSLASVQYGRLKGLQACLVAPYVRAGLEEFVINN